MCFMTTYSCEITCLNQELDMAAIVNGTIKGIGSLPNSCHTVCTQIATESFETSTNPIWGSGIIGLNIIVAIVLTLAVVIVYLWWTKPKKPEGGEKDGLLQEMPPTKPGNGTP